ncbi:MAG: hypothetical protein RDV48_12360 [Candidatus Eremiobacteraeota bacterium]|nr:hypothetical protein [Candidatus Eremiobacteraeota bacterium]
MPPLVMVIENEVKRLELKIRFRDERRQSERKNYVINVVVPLFLAVPGILLNIIALVINGSLWKTTVMVSKGGFYKAIPAYNNLIVMAVFIVFYGLSYFDFMEEFLGGWAVFRGATMPSEAEKKVAVWFLRIVLLVLLYAMAIGSLRAPA